MRYFLHKFRHLILLPVLLGATGVLAERTFKWRDEEGHIHYGDRVPLQYSTRERKEINEQGRTLKPYEAPQPPEQHTGQEQFANIDIEEQRRLEEQASYDQKLLATYSSEADLQMARDSKLDSMEELVQLTNSRNSSLQRQLDALTEEAADYQRRGKPVPKFVLHQTENVRGQISGNEAIIEAKRREMEDIRQQFAADLDRYHELQDGD